MTNMTPTVDQARYRLERAQEKLRAAETAQATLDTFPVVGEVHAVMARVPSFDQFVSYSTEGILIAVCTSEEEAARYVRDVAPPVGYYLVPEKIDLFG
jgi:hypothetical protein